MNTTYETKNKAQNMSDSNENIPGYKKSGMDEIPAGHIISDPVANAIDYCRDAMQGYYTSEISGRNAICCRDAMHGVSKPEIVHGYCQYAIYGIYAVTVRCRDAMHRVSTDHNNGTNQGISMDKISQPQNAH